MKNKLKGRTNKTYENKVSRLTKLYNHCPKIQVKITLKQFLEKIKKPNK